MQENEFNALAAQGYNRIPVTLETFADLDTALSIYLKLANNPWSFLLESVQGGERFGRYSVIGLAADTRIEVYGRSVLLLTGNRLIERRDDGDPLTYPADNSMRRAMIRAWREKGTLRSAGMLLPFDEIDNFPLSAEKFK